MEIGFKTDKGLRRNNNEDACFVMKDENIFIVADGVGGNNSGEIASRTAVNEIVNFVEEHSISKVKTDSKLEAYFNQCIEEVNIKVLELSNRFEENKGMATTVVIAYVKNNRLYIVNVGDSRAYVLRRKTLSQITEDHTYVNTLVKAGIITEIEAETHENRNMITRAVGADEEIESDFFNVEIQVGDIILICTDGLYGEIEENELTNLLNKEETMTNICNELVEMANENGGNDNITMVCLRITEDDVK